MMVNFPLNFEKADPDIIIGYNIVNFDIPYLLDRAKALKVPKASCWSRISVFFPFKLCLPQPEFSHFFKR